MRIRWPRFLPGFPAVLLVPVVLGLWIWLCMTPQIEPRGKWQWDWNAGRGREFIRVWKGKRGVPFAFLGHKMDPRRGAHTPRRYGFKPIPFTADLAIALAVAYGLAIALDRLVFPAIRGARESGRPISQL